MDTTQTASTTCTQCRGVGRVEWTRFAQSVCFPCKGTGRVKAAKARGYACICGYAYPNKEQVRACEEVHG